jgi:hypothetical protein
MQTVIEYQDTPLPIVGVVATLANAVTLFNSAVAFASPSTPSGGSFHLLNQQWFQYNIFFDSAADTGVGNVVGQFSDDKGATWTTYYTSLNIANVTPESDEIYVGMFKDVRFMYVQTVSETTVFSANLALNDCKPTSKITLDDRLVQAVP